MQENILEPKSINSLLGESFYIPSYQRGYRWTENQVTDLLNDIKEFQKESEDGDRKQFYCLQPVVVKKRDDQWEVVDGQQRLTTIYIILTALKFHLEEYGYSHYTVEYQTRPESSSFLNNINEEQAEDNIDFYHMSNARKAVDKWFKSQDPMYKSIIFKTLLSNDEIGKNVKVIWYELGDHENAVEVFTRLNMGKIPLVNAELVKALFLKSSQFKKTDEKIRQLQQVNISQEWDEIENALQDDAFWYFLSNEDVKTNRIEYILKIRASQSDFAKIDTHKEDKLKVFLQFNNQLSSENIKISEEWLKIKQTFMTLKEWFKDRTLFHKIGFLISQDKSILDIIQIYADSDGKNDFNKNMTNIIIKMAFKYPQPSATQENEFTKHVKEYVNELQYPTNPKELRRTLLLFNIASLLSNPESNARFQFEKYKIENWDIEHIHSVVSDMPSKNYQQVQWLEHLIDYLSDDEYLEPQSHAITQDTAVVGTLDEAALIKTKALEIYKKPFSTEQFKAVYDSVMNFYTPREDGEVDNSIGNLTLLDSFTNRSYKNALFPIKRKRLIALDKKATYVPLCTKNVFLKYYSKDIDKMLYWRKEDAENYQTAITDMFTTFFSQAETL